MWPTYVDEGHASILVLIVAAVIQGWMLLGLFWILWKGWDGLWAVVYWIIPRLPERVRRRIAGKAEWEAAGNEW